MSSPATGGEQPLLAHLLELRNRLLKIFGGIFLCFLPLAFYAKEVYGIAAAPLLKLLPPGASMIATQVASPFFAPVKLACVIAAALSMPWTLWQIWAFVAPGLYKNERRLAAPLMISSSLLFYGGVGFAYFVVLPMLFHFMLVVAPAGVAVMPDINEYLNTVLALSLAFGLSFELPVAVVLLVISGFVTPAQLRNQRGYVLVGVFVAAAVLTPPDPLSQVLLAVPLYLLYEAGILATGLIASSVKPAKAVVDSPKA